MDGLNWIKDVDAYTPIKELNHNDRVEIVWRNAELVDDALESCDEYYSGVFKIGDMYEVVEISPYQISAEGIYCGNCERIVDKHNLKGDCGTFVYSVELKDVNNPWTFWVTEDMLRMARVE